MWRTDGRTDRQTENTIHRAAWSQLKTIGRLFYAISSFVHHFVDIGEFKLELQSWNAQFGSNSKSFRAVWPWNLTDDFQQGKSEGFDSCDRASNLKLDSNRQFFRLCDREIWWMTLQQGKSEGFDSCDRPSNLKLDSNRQFFRLCDREIWWMTLQKYRTPLLCNFKLCASFRSHWWIQTWVTVRKRPIWVKLDDF